MKNKTLIVGLSAVFAMTGISSANLLMNGDFNTVTDVLEGGTGTVVGVTADNWEAWAWGNGWSSTEIATGGNWVDTNPDGTYQQTVGASGGGGGGAFQTVLATAGQEYELTVLSGAEKWWLPTGTMSLIWLDGSNVEISNNSRNTVDPAVYGEDQFDVRHPWETYMMTATAPAGTVSVKVEFLANNATGSVGFDNADLQAVPEPATLSLLGLAAGALLMMRRRFKN